MPLPKVTFAAAGSGKTQKIVTEALGEQRRILIITYTEQNTSELRARLSAHHGFLPQNIEVLTWYSFLLRHCVRPYQKPLYSSPRLENIYFASDPAARKAIGNRRYIPKKQVKDRYIFSDDLILGEFASEFAVQCDDANGGGVIKRLEKIYSRIFVDEVQDLAGYDLVLLEKLFCSTIQIDLVGDCRQITYKTNSISNKYQNFRDAKILDFFQNLQTAGKCNLHFDTISRRCNQEICDFADSLYPQMPKTTSQNASQDDHKGVFFVQPDDVEQYYELYKPQILTWDRRVETVSGRRMNYGQSKGLTFDRTLIYPTQTIRTFLLNGDPSILTNPSKFYVAITRARNSVALVYDGIVHGSINGNKYVT